MNGALFRLALRRLLLRRRSALLAFAPMLAALVAIVQAAGGTADAKSFAGLMEQLFLPTILPFLALVIGSSAIGEERDDGTILYLASTPLPRLAIALPAIVAAALTTVVLCLPGLAVVIALSPGDDFSVSAALLGGRLGRGGRLRLRRGVRGALAAGQAAGGDRARLRPLLGGLDRDVRAQRALALARRLRRAVVAGGLPSSTDYNVPAIGGLGGVRGAGGRGRGGHLVVRAAPDARRVALARARGYRRAVTYTLLHDGDPSIESIRGVFFKMRRALGTTAFGINEVRVPPNATGTEHDEVRDGARGGLRRARGSRDVRDRRRGHRRLGRRLPARRRRRNPPGHGRAGGNALHRRRREAQGSYDGRESL